MSIRESFVEVFGEDNAVRVEEASLGHINEAPISNVHVDDKWGSDPFRYHLMNCISRACFTDKWKGFHGLDVEYEAVRQWCFDHGDLLMFDGDPPDYIGLLAGVYYAWIDWERADTRPPDGWSDFEDNQRKWQNLTPTQQAEEMKALAEEGMKLLNHHGLFGEGPPEEGTG